MREILDEKLEAFKESYFENKEYRIWLRDSDLWMAAYTCLRINGIEMGKKELVDVLEGKLMEEIPLDIYRFAQSFRELYKDMQASLIMQDSLNPKLLKRFYAKLFNGEGYRHDNPVVFKWNFVPTHFNSIDDELEALCKDVDKIGDPIDRAVAIHLGIDKIYPFGKDTPIIAAIAMFYELLKGGIPLPSFTVDNEEYDKLIAKYLSDGTDEFSAMFIRSEINRLESVMMLGIESMER